MRREYWLQNFTFLFRFKFWHPIEPVILELAGSKRLQSALDLRLLSECIYIGSYVLAL